MQPIFRSSLIALSALAVAACSSSSDDNPPPAALVSQSVGAAGGTLTNNAAGALQGLSLTIPAGALAAAVQIEIFAANAPANGPAAAPVSVSSAARFEPDGTAFTAAATVVFPYDSSRIPTGRTAQDLVAVRQDSAGNMTTIAPSSVDATGQTITFDITGFSTHWVGAPAAPGGGGGGGTFDLSTYVGAWSGSWTNTTFQSTGSASATVVDAGNGTATIMLDLGGNVFGEPDPAAENFTATVIANMLTLAPTTSSTYGQVIATLSATGMLTAGGTNVPSSNVDLWGITGTWTGTELTVQVVIGLAGGQTANAQATLTRQQG